ncbi:uncharacterized protein J3R85_019666 [Psidium guajava]|nr:uncharacterized protein J3R85_019666 [Psidium guajava]
MAEAALFGVASEIIKRVGSLVVKEIADLWGLKDELEKLVVIVSTIQNVLLDAEEAYEKNHQVKSWLMELKQVMYDADDLLDEYTAEALKRQILASGDAANKEVSKNFHLVFSSMKDFILAIKTRHKMKSIRERLDCMAANRKFHLAEYPFETRFVAREREQTHSYVRAEEVIGRDDDKNAILKFLLTPSHIQDDVSIISIIGIGGLGKTTLAQLVCNDELVKKNFEIHMWVCISDIFDIRLILEKMIKSATEKDLPQNMEIDQLQKLFRRKIEGKKYILVLDDVWNEIPKKWLDLRGLLMGGARGSKVLITTRSKLVADSAGADSLYFLGGLSRNQSWSLLKQMAFRRQEQELNDPRLKEMGLEIVDKCSGVPLAIRSVGRVLYSKRTVAEWSDFKNSKLAKVALQEDGIIPILKLSYDHLPSHLKQCFAYSSIFPKDYRIDRMALINLWMAQGFIPSSDVDPNKERLGNEYFMDLLWRSFFQDVQEDELGNIVNFKMHDLMHDLAQLVAGTECMIVDFSSGKLDKRVRHVSYSCNFDLSWTRGTSYSGADKLRSFLLLNQSPFHSVPNKPFYDTVVGSFRGLRSLNMSNSGVTMLPVSISNLTLILTSCYNLEKLPTHMEKLINLRHLDIDRCANLKQVSCGLGKLQSLQSLGTGGITISRQSCWLTELKDLNNLHGELRIVDLGHDDDATLEWKDVNLKDKRNLQSLVVEWGPESHEDEGVLNDVKMLEDIKGLWSLKQLMIEWYGGARFPNWMMQDLRSYLPNLVKIRLDSCFRCQYLPPLHQLACLKDLYLGDLSDIECIIEFGEVEVRPSGGDFFPVLAELWIVNMPNLKKWWRKEEASKELLPSIPHLSYLVILDCPNLLSLPLLPSLEKLDVYGVNEKLLSPQMSTAESSSSLCRLKKLRIGEVHKLESLSEKWLQNLTSLEFMWISDCPRLMSLSQGLPHLSSLEILGISNCKDIDFKEVESGSSVQSKGFLNLRSVTIKEAAKPDCLPQRFELFPNLEKLEIESCSGLVSLPESIGNLQSLKRLRIFDCQQLTSLPTAVSSLAGLQELELSSCPRVMEKMPSRERRRSA